MQLEERPLNKALGLDVEARRKKKDDNCNEVQKKDTCAVGGGDGAPLSVVLSCFSWSFLLLRLCSAPVRSSLRAASALI